MVYKVVMKFPDGSSEEEDEIFQSESEAVAHGEYMVSCHALGGEILHLSNPGDYPLSDDEADFEVIEVVE